jgi:hypothetical protein
MPSGTSESLRPGVGAGHGRQQRLGVVILRILEDLPRVPLLHDPAVVHHGDGLGEVADHGEVVADQQHAHTAILGLVDEAQHLPLDRGVERGGGLVRDQQFRVAGQGRGDQGALAQAAGELIRTLTRAQFGLGDADVSEQFQHPLATLGRVQVGVQAQDLVDLAAHGAQRIEGEQRVLQHESDPAAADAPPARLAERGQVLGGCTAQ